MAVLGRYIPGLLLSYLIRKYGIYLPHKLNLLIAFLAIANFVWREDFYILVFQEMTFLYFHVLFRVMKIPFFLPVPSSPHIKSFSYQVLETDKGPQERTVCSYFRREFLESVVLCNSRT